MPTGNPASHAQPQQGRPALTLLPAGSPLWSPLGPLGPRTTEWIHSLCLSRVCKLGAQPLEPRPKAADDIYKPGRAPRIWDDAYS
eukprot:7259322-Ditylum_brightwellii.AAC.1